MAEASRIYYSPLALKWRLNGYGRERLQNRGGLYIAFTPEGDYLHHVVGDSVLEAADAANDYIREHPTHQVVIWESNCFSTGDDLPGNQVPPTIQQLVKKGEQ